MNTLTHGQRIRTCIPKGWRKLGLDDIIESGDYFWDGGWFPSKAIGVPVNKAWGMIAGTRPRYIRKRYQNKI